MIPRLGRPFVAALAFSLACAGVASCGAPQEHVQAAVASPAEASAADARPDRTTAETVAAGARAYPPSYPRLEESELARREEAAAQRNAGWDITVDALGFLATAERPAFAPGDRFTSAERKAVDDLLANNQDLTGGDPRGLALAPEATSSLVWQELVAGVVVSWVRADKTRGRLRVEGHLWPGFDVPDGAEIVGDDAARQALVPVDPITDAEHAPLKRGVRVTAASAAGPFEVHLCIAFDRTAPPRSFGPTPARPGPPCVDAVTGTVVVRAATFRTTSTTRDGHRETSHRVDVN